MTDDKWPWTLWEFDKVCDWGGKELNRKYEIPRLRIGDCVRVLIVTDDNKEFQDKEFWEKIYVEITQIVYYNKTSREQRNKIKLFRGKVLDTYRWEEVWCKTGSEITFMPKHVMEIPKWNSAPPSHILQTTKYTPLFQPFKKNNDFNYCVKKCLHLKGQLKIDKINNFLDGEIEENKCQNFINIFKKYIKPDIYDI